MGRFRTIPQPIAKAAQVNTTQFRSASGALANRETARNTPIVAPTGDACDQERVVPEGIADPEVQQVMHGTL